LPKVLEKWQLANSAFEPPVVNSQVCHSIPKVVLYCCNLFQFVKITMVKRIQDSWDQARDVSLGRGKLSVKDAFLEKLDKLFDILNCKCEMVPCRDHSCPVTCTKEIHVTCSCAKEKRIPPASWCTFMGRDRKEAPWDPIKLDSLTYQRTSVKQNK
jgi:hypothetical protein